MRFLRPHLDPELWRDPLRAWLVSRVVVLVSAFVASALFGVPPLGVDRAVPHSVAVLGGWDTSWYLDIATRGYDHYTDLAGTLYTNLPFFPMVPLVMKVGIALHVNPFLFAVAVNHVVFLGALVVLNRLTRERFDASVARTTVWAAALFPPSAYMSLAYTEAITVLLAVSAALLAYHRRWGWAGAVAAAATLARPPGVLIAGLVAAIAWGAGGTRHHERLRRMAVALVPAGVTLLAFLAWMQLTRGAWNLPFIAQEAWKRGPLGLGLITYLPVEIGDSIRALLRGDLHDFWYPAARQGIVTVFYLVLLRRLWRQEGGWRSPWVLYAAATLALPLSSGSLTSMTRFGLLAFPLVWAGATWLNEGTEKRRQYAVIAGVVGLAALVFELQFSSP